MALNMYIRYIYERDRVGLLEINGYESRALDRIILAERVLSVYMQLELIVYVGNGRLY